MYNHSKKAEDNNKSSAFLLFLQLVAKLKIYLYINKNNNKCFLIGFTGVARMVCLSLTWVRATPRKSPLLGGMYKKRSFLHKQNQAVAILQQSILFLVWEEEYKFFKKCRHNIHHKNSNDFYPALLHGIKPDPHFLLTDRK